MQHHSRKETAWRKNRKFSDIHGGRTSLKLTDGIFRRVHALKRPAPGDQLPLFISENPSRDFFHPLDAEALRQELQR
ncbi:MAG TPA: hypothetical protein VHX44_01425, partial [Planctomycetota bacterium]|nr:hypothetical protein [Planctomycetota bacterium]